MSALGQKQTLGKVRLMSALPPESGHGDRAMAIHRAWADRQC